MKCANEIVEIRSNANAAYEAEEKARLIAEYVKACANSVALCEGRISKKLEEAANTHGEKNVSISIPIETYQDRLGNEIFSLVIEHKHSYANGDSSWAPDRIMHSYTALAEYLAQFCYKTEIQRRVFVRKCWGCGDCHYDALVITTAPACM